MSMWSMVKRDPTNELYDRACSLLADASELRRAAARPGNDAAVAATLGCLETAMGQLAETYRLLERTSGHRLRGERGRLAESFDEAVLALEHARTASEDARAFVGPRLARDPASR